MDDRSDNSDRANPEPLPAMFIGFGRWLTWTALTAIPVVGGVPWLYASWMLQRPRLMVTAGLYFGWPLIGIIASTIFSAIFFDNVRGLEGWLDGVGLRNPHGLLILWVNVAMWLVSVLNAQIEWRSWRVKRTRRSSSLVQIDDDALPAARPYWICLVLWITLGWSGAHRFYTRRWSSGLFYLFTLGLFGAGWAADVFLLRRMLLGAPRLGSERVVQRAPWADEHEHQSWASFVGRLMFFLIAPFLFVGSCVYFHHLELLAVLVLVVVACGLLGNLERVIGRLDLLDKIPITRPAVSFIHDLHQYYFHTRPRPFMHYLLWPIYVPLSLCGSSSARQEMKLYGRFLLTLYVVIAVKEVRSFNTHYQYMSASTVATWFGFHFLFATLVTATFIVPIVTTSFTLNLAGLQGRLRTLSVIVLATTLPIAAYTFYRIHHNRTPTIISTWRLDSREESPQFRSDLAWQAEVFLRHYLGRIPNVDEPHWSAVHTELTERFRQHVQAMLEPSEANALEVRVVRDVNSPDPTLAVVENWVLPRFRRTRTLFTMTSGGRFFSTWGRLPPHAHKIFAAIENDKPREEDAYKIAQQSVAYDRKIYDVAMTCVFQAPSELEPVKDNGEPTFQPQLTANLRASLLEEGVTDADQFRIYGWDDGRNQWRCVRDAQYLWTLSDDDNVITQQWDRPQLKAPSRQLLYLEQLEHFEPIDSLDLTQEPDRQLARDLVREHTRVFLTDAARHREPGDTLESLSRDYRTYIADLVPEHQRERFRVVALNDQGWLGVVYKDLPLFTANASGHFYPRGANAPTVARQFLERRY